MHYMLFFDFIRLYIRTLTQLPGCCMIFSLCLFPRGSPYRGEKTGKTRIILSVMPCMRKGGNHTLSSFVLRLMALLCMFVDHAGLALFPSVGIFRCVGRLAFPLYCFLIAQGFCHTRDIRAYARRLLFLALVSEVPFDLLIFGRISSAMEQNVVFALLLGLLALCAVRSLKGKPLLSAMAVFALMLVAMAAKVSFGWLGIALCLAFDYAHDDRILQALSAVLLPALYSLTLLLSGVSHSWVMVSLCACLSAVPIFLYNGKPGLHHRALTFAFYAAYPLHLCFLLLIRAMRIIPPYFLH